jgi:RNA polymerase sigma-70 factor (ECF subfamily)
MDLMDRNEWLADRFEEHRGHLRAVAYRMLGSFAEADDAVQESWIRLSRADTSEVENLSAWLTTVVARVCLNVLRTRRAHREESLDTHVPDPIVGPESGLDPEREAVLADSVGLAMLVVLEMLAPAERLAFVLHDMFGISFDEIATILGRSSTAARQLASRARRRVQGSQRVPDTDLAGQRQVVDAFFAAAHRGEFEALIAVLDPEATLRADGGPLRPAASVVLHGAAAVASQALMFSRPLSTVYPASINGAAGVIVVVDGKPFSLMAFTVRGGRVVEINAVTDPERLRQLDLSSIGLA